MQLSRADAGDYLECRRLIDEMNGSWESNTLMVAQIGTFRGKMSTRIDSIVIRNNGNHVLIKYEIKPIENEVAEWEIIKKVIKLANSLDKESLATLMDVASISVLQNHIKEMNSSSISEYKRYLHIYMPESKWVTNELITFPALSNNPRECEKWEKKFRSIFNAGFPPDIVEKTEVDRVSPK